MTDRPPTPSVTISGGPATAAAPDVLDAGDEQGAGSGRPRGRGRLTALVGLGLLAVLGAAGEVADRQAVAEAVRAQEHREREAVELQFLGDWSGTSSYEPATGQLSYHVDMTVRNEGPRAVELLAIGLPGVQLAAPIELDAGRERPLSLQGSYACSVGHQQPRPAPTTVPFEVRTDAGPRYVDLSIPSGMFDTDPLAEACHQARAAEVRPPTAST